MIRAAVTTDYEAMDRLQTASVRALCAQSYPDSLIAAWVGTPKPQRYRRNAAKGADYYLLIEQNRLCGFCGIRLKDRLVEAVFVNPVCTGKGVGRQMMQHLFTIARQHTIDELLVESSLNAVGFYRRYGFVEYARRQIELSDGLPIDAVLMRRSTPQDNPATDYADLAD